MQTNYYFFLCKLIIIKAIKPVSDRYPPWICLIHIGCIATYTCELIFVMDTVRYGLDFEGCDRDTAWIHLWVKMWGGTTLLRCKLLICSRVSFSKSEMVLGGEVLDLQCICMANSSMNREKFRTSQCFMIGEFVDHWSFSC